MNAALPSGATGQPSMPARVSHARIMGWLDQVMDPEVPVVSLVELGIAREARLAPDGAVEIVLTPTYSGCPATELIEQQARAAVEAAVPGPVRVLTQRAPAWTTDWISAEGRRKLREYGIAPPGPVAAGQGVPIRLVRRGAAATAVDCPRCGSADTERLSAFGSTACKSLWRCRACREPFEHFKPI